MPYVKIGIAAVAILILILVASRVYEAGRMEERNDQLEQNDRARSGADDFDDGLARCRAVGGVFDFGAGKCARP